MKITLVPADPQPVATIEKIILNDKEIGTVRPWAHKEGHFYAGLDLALSGHSFSCGGVGPSKEEAIRKSAENGLEIAKAAVASLEQILTDLEA